MWLDLPLTAGDRTAVSLILSLIQLRPEAFGEHHAEHAAEVTDPPDLSRTQERLLGKRVGLRTSAGGYSGPRFPVGSSDPTHLAGLAAT